MAVAGGAPTGIPSTPTANSPLVDISVGILVAMTEQLDRRAEQQQPEEGT
jgi:hypothetical protein